MLEDAIVSEYSYALVRQFINFKWFFTWKVSRTIVQRIWEWRNIFSNKRLNLLLVESGSNDAKALYLKNWHILNKQAKDYENLVNKVIYNSLRVRTSIMNHFHSKFERIFIKPFYKPIILLFLEKYLNFFIDDKNFNKIFRSDCTALGSDPYWRENWHLVASWAWDHYSIAYNRNYNVL